MCTISVLNIDKITYQSCILQAAVSNYRISTRAMLSHGNRAMPVFVNFEPYVNNTINNGLLWRTDVKLRYVNL